jgi:hypothetical protein
MLRTLNSHALANYSSEFARQSQKNSGGLNMMVRKSKNSVLTLMCTLLAIGPAAQPSSATIVPSNAVYVTNFGAVGDGVTDSTAAINKALLCGNNIYLPAGTYLASSALYIPSNTNVYGAGEGATTIKLTKSIAGPFVSFGQWSSPGPVANSSIQQLTIDGGRNCGSNTTHEYPGIFAGTGCSSITVSNVEVRNVLGNGIGLYGTNMAAALKCYVHGCHGFGIATRGHANIAPNVASKTNIAGNYVTDCQAWSGDPSHWSGSMAGIYVGWGSQNCTVQQNRVVNNSIALYESGASTSSNNSVVNNIVSNNTAASLASPANAIDILGPERNFTVSGNKVTGSAGWDIFIDGAVVCGNVLNNNLGVAKSGAIALTNVNVYGLNIASTPPNSVNVEYNHIAILIPEPAIYVLPACTNINVQCNTIVGAISL